MTDQVIPQNLDNVVRIRLFPPVSAVKKNKKIIHAPVITAFLLKMLKG